MKKFKSKKTQKYKWFLETLKQTGGVHNRLSLNDF